MMLKLKLQYFGHLCMIHWKRLWCWEGLGAGGEGDDRGWDGWMASLTQWTWVWVNSRSWWWTGRPGVLWFMGSQRVGHDWVTELNCTCILHEGTEGFRDESNMALASQNHQTGPSIPLECLLLVPIEARAAGLQNNWNVYLWGCPRNSVGERWVLSWALSLWSFTVAQQQPVFRDFSAHF